MGEFEADTEAEVEGDEVEGDQDDEAEADVVGVLTDPYQGFIAEVDDDELDVKEQGIFDSEAKHESSADGDGKPPEKRRRTLGDLEIEKKRRIQGLRWTMQGMWM